MPGALPIIGYENLLESGTTTGDGSNPANAYDWLTYDAWTTAAASGYLENTPGGTQNVNYLAWAGHDIFTQTGDIKLQYWTGAYTDVPGSSVTPGSDKPGMVVFPSVSSTKFKVVLSNLDAAATVALVSIGTRLELERGATAGFVAPTFGRQDRILNATAQGGQLLGRSLIRTGLAGKITLAHLSESWVRISMDGWITHSREKGWFLLWNKDALPNEVAYCWTTATPRPSYEAPGMMKADVAFEGLTV